MSLIVALILGVIVGWAASRLLGREGGILGSMIIGVVGSVVGSWVSLLFTGGDRAYLALSWTGLFWSFVGAVIFVAVLNLFQRPHHNQPTT